MSIRSTAPPRLPQGDAEDIVYGFNVAALLTGVQTVTLPVSELTRAGGPAVTLADLPTVAGAVVNQRVRAGVITAGRYRLAVRFTPSGTTNILESVLEITFDG